MRNPTRKLSVLVALLAIALAVSACGGGGNGSGSPTDVVEEGISRLFEPDIDGFRELLCADVIADFDASMEGTDMSQMEALFDQVDVNLSGLEYNVSDETDDSATVTISGTLEVSVAGETQEVPVGDFLTEADEIPVVREDGDWKICDTSLAGGM
ncbi:MAG: hypothetical protein ACOCZH_00435 [Phototrophicaceae bacterium]